MAESSSKMSTIAGRLLARGNPFDDVVRMNALLTAMTGTTNEDKIDCMRGAFGEIIKDARSLAASVLAQDETPGQG